MSWIRAFERAIRTRFFCFLKEKKQKRAQTNATIPNAIK